jgi:SNF2 family DNA or RNA helicase
VEEKIVELQSTKRELAQAVLGEGRGTLRELTREDLEGLLS